MWIWVPFLGPLTLLAGRNQAAPTASVLPGPAITASSGAIETYTPGPNLLTQQVYSNPGEEFAFSMGIDGKSLWRVAKDGESVQWVNTEEEFFFLS